jgi:hypothetical protein
MNLPRALEHLARVGVTADVLRAGGVDPGCPTAVRGEVETLLRSVVAEAAIIDMRGFAALQMAFGALLTAEERRDGTAMAAAIRADLTTAGVVRAAPGQCRADG